MAAYEPELRIRRPSLDDLAHLHTLRFGDAVRAPVWRPDPAHARHAPTAALWHDPWAPAGAWFALEALLRAELLRFEWVRVYDDDGEVLFAGHHAGRFAAWPWGAAHRVRASDDGKRLIVAIGGES